MDCQLVARRSSAAQPDSSKTSDRGLQSGGDCGIATAAHFRSFTATSPNATITHAGIATKLSFARSPAPEGATNLRLLQQLRELNATAQIIMHAEWFADVAKLYAAGANYVSLPRQIEAQQLFEAIIAARDRKLEEKRHEQALELIDRDEVIP
jgi:hypothetical protein